MGAVWEGDDSRILPPILSGKFSRTAHVEVIFVVLSCLKGSKICYVENYLRIVRSDLPQFSSILSSGYFGLQNPFRLSTYLLSGTEGS